MNACHRVAALLAIAALVGCGPSVDASKPSAAQPAPAPAVAKSDASARKDDALPAPDCPARLETALQGPDVVGLKLGMRRDAALNFARCLDRDTVLTFEANWLNGLKTYGIKLAPQAFSARTGEATACSYRNFSDMQKCGPGNRVWTHLAEEITVVSPGVPGEEKVAAIWRTQNFKAGAMPAGETTLQALVEKYGMPQVRRQQQDQWIQLYWLKDPGGTPLAQNSRGAQMCQGILARPEGTQQWREGCGLTIAAQIDLARENPLLVKRLDIALTDQQALLELGTRLQNQLQELEAQRRLKELDTAKTSGAAVKL